MNLPEPADVKWTDDFMDYGRQYVLAVESTTLKLSHAVRVPTSNCLIPQYPSHEQLKQVLLRWYWRRLGAA
jgi:hypothetical protein